MYDPPDISAASDQARECTFAPAINGRSRALVERSVDLPNSFLERQVREGTRGVRCEGRDALRRQGMHGPAQQLPRETCEGSEM